MWNVAWWKFSLKVIDISVPFFVSLSLSCRLNVFLSRSQPFRSLCAFTDYGIHGSSCGTVLLASVSEVKL